MNFVSAGVSLVVNSRHHHVAVHHPRSARPRARHAYRLSQVITYGIVLPQTFVN